MVVSLFPHRMRFASTRVLLSWLLSLIVRYLPSIWSSVTIWSFTLLYIMLFGDPRWGNSYSQVVQNKEEWSRLIGYGSGLEIVKFSLTKPEWAAPALGPRGKWGDKEQLASLDHCSTRWVLLVVCRTEKLLFSFRSWLVAWTPSLFLFIVIVARRSRPNLMLWKGQAQA